MVNLPTCVLVNVLRDQQNVANINEKLFAKMMDTNRYVDIEDTDVKEDEVIR